jgi:hypothetical protein
MHPGQQENLQPRCQGASPSLGEGWTNNVHTKKPQLGFQCSHEPVYVNINATEMGYALCMMIL